MRPWFLRPKGDSRDGRLRAGSVGSREKAGEGAHRQEKEGFYGVSVGVSGGEPADAETIQDGLRRIVQEELGIDVEVGDYLCSSAHVIHCQLSIKSYVYEATHLSGDFAMKDYDEVRWAAPEELERYDFAEPHRYVALMLMKNA